MSTSIPIFFEGQNSKLFHLAGKIHPVLRTILIPSEFAKIKNKTPMESFEDIEILRFLELGFKVKMIKMSNKSLAVDNNDDLEKAKIYLKYKKL